MYELMIIIDNNIIVKTNAELRTKKECSIFYYRCSIEFLSQNLPNSRRLYIFITDGEVLLVVEEDNLSNDLRPIDGEERNSVFSKLFFLNYR